MPDVSNWPAGQTGSIGRSIKLPRRRAQRRFSSRAIQIQLPHPVVAVSIHAPAHMRPRTHVRTPVHPEFHPRDIFLPRHVQRAAQRSVASLCSFPSSPRRFFFLPASPRSAPLRPARSVFPFSSLLGSSLCCLLLLRVCQRQSFFCPLSHLVSVSQHRELDPAGVSQRSRRRPQNMLSSLIFLTQFLRSGFIRETLTGNLAE